MAAAASTPESPEAMDEQDGLPATATRSKGGHQAEVLYQHEGQLNPNAKRNAKKQQKKAKQAAASVASDGSGSDFDLDALPESDDELSE